MKNQPIYWLALIAVSLIAFSCEKDEEPAKPKLVYEVITGSGKWSGEFNDGKGKRLYLQEIGPIEAESGWKYTFEQDTVPLEMHIFAEASCPSCDGTRDPSPDITVNLYVDDELVKTETNKWAKGVTSGTFILNK